MKTSIALCAATIISLATTFHTRAEVMAGPVTNPANGHDYYLLAPASWPAAEGEAENLGGSLAIIRTADEHNWVFAQFGHDGDNKERSLWIGLHRQWPGGPFVWVDGSKVDYVNWDAGQPDNAGGNEIVSTSVPTIISAAGGMMPPSPLRSAPWWKCRANPMRSR